MADEETPVETPEGAWTRALTAWALFGSIIEAVHKEVGPGTLREAAEAIPEAQDNLESLPDKVADKIVTWWDGVKEGLANLSTAWLERVALACGIPEDEVNHYVETISENPLVRLVAGVLLATSIWNLQLQYAAELWSAPKKQDANEKAHPFWPDWRDILRLRWWDNDKTGDEDEAKKVYYDALKKAGIHPDTWPVLQHLSEQRPDLDTLTRMYHTGDVDADTWATEVIRQGYILTDYKPLFARIWRWPDPALVLAMQRRGILTPDEARKWLWAGGVPDGMEEHYAKVYQQLLPLDAIRTLYQRKWLTPEETQNYLLMLGFREEDIPRISQLWTPTHKYTGDVPPVQDVIRMAVRDAFNPYVVERYGLDLNFPEELADFAEHTGLGAYWARMYWRAHWQMPSFATARMLLFRSPRFNLDDFRRTLIYADYPPALVDAMVDAAYEPLTRVDVRRMHAMGVLSTQEVYEAYRKHGYNDTDAQRMTEFTVRYNTEEPRAESATRVLNALRERTINYDQAVEALTAIGYKADDAAHRCGAVLVERAILEAQDELDTLRAQWLRGELTDSEAISAIAALGYAAEDAQAIFDGWQRYRIRTRRRPSRTDWRKFWQAGLISADRYVQELVNLGYSEEHARLYLALEQTEA